MPPHHQPMSREGKVKVLIAQSCPTLCHSMDCSMPGFPALFHHNLKKYICVHFKEDGALGHPSLLYGRNFGVFRDAWSPGRRHSPSEGIRDLLLIHKSHLNAYTQTLMTNSPPFPKGKGAPCLTGMFPLDTLGAFQGRGSPTHLGPGEQALSSHSVLPPGQKQVPGQAGLGEEKCRVKTGSGLSQTPESSPPLEVTHTHRGESWKPVMWTE